MSTNCHFYATREDLLTVTGRVESNTCIKYIRYGHVTKLPAETFESAAEIPNLGMASHESGTTCEKFLVANSRLEMEPRRINTTAGEEKFAIDQLRNPDTIVLNPGGLWKREILLNGSVGAAHDTEASKTLMKLFQSAIKSEFSRIRAFWVGPQAMEMLKSGKRLTPAEQSPGEFDLKTET